MTLLATGVNSDDMKHSAHISDRWTMTTYGLALGS